MSGILTQLGVKDEVTFGTGVTVDRFFEYNSEGIQLDAARIESSALRASTRVQRSDRFAVNRKGAAGSLEMEVLTKGFGWWLKHLLGAVATSGPNADGRYTHTGTVASLSGDFFTLQVNRPFVDGSNQAFTYEGGKVATWSLSNSVDGLLMLTLELDFEDESTGVALATASYPTGAELFSFVGGTVTVGGTAFDVSSASVSCDNGLKRDRHFIRGSSLKKEPLEAAFRDIGFELSADWESLAQYSRYVSTTAAGALAQIVLTWQGPTLIAGSSYPLVTVTIPAARFDGSTPNVGGPDLLTQTLTGKALSNGTDSAITVALGTADATP